MNLAKVLPVGVPQLYFLDVEKAQRESEARLLIIMSTDDEADASGNADNASVVHGVRLANRAVSHSRRDSSVVLLYFGSLLAALASESSI